MATAKTRPIRTGEIEARRNAFAAARLMITDGKSQEEAGEALGVNRTTVGEAMLIMQFGTVEEIAKVEGGQIALRVMRDAIMARTTPAERAAKRRPPTQTAALKEARRQGVEVWEVLKTGLGAFTSLPSPKETATIVRNNAGRMEHTNRTLLVALTWIQEFSDEITK